MRRSKAVVVAAVTALGLGLILISGFDWNEGNRRTVLTDLVSHALENQGDSLVDGVQLLVQAGIPFSFKDMISFYVHRTHLTDL
jgi:hypothetical protein